ncbi:MAG: hypothetical protein ABL897_09550, partial [Hyphomicrobium sp.]
PATVARSQKPVAPLGLAPPSQRDAAVAFTMPPIASPTTNGGPAQRKPVQQMPRSLPPQAPAASNGGGVQAPTTRSPPPTFATPIPVPASLSAQPPAAPLADAIARVLPQNLPPLPPVQPMNAAPVYNAGPPPLPARLPPAVPSPDFSKLPPGVAASLARLAAGNRPPAADPATQGGPVSEGKPVIKTGSG